MDPLFFLLRRLAVATALLAAFCFLPGWTEDGDVVLTGTQEEKLRVLDLSKRRVTLKGSYILPEGCTLKIINAGNFAVAPDQGGGGIEIHGTLLIGEPVPKKDARDFGKLPIIVAEALRLKILGKNARVVVEAVNLRRPIFMPKLGALEARGCVFEPDSVILMALQPGFKMSFRDSLMAVQEFEMDDGLAPGTLLGNFEFRNCVFGKGHPIPLNFAWCLQKCDIHVKSPFRLKDFAWESPAALPPSYFSDLQFLKYYNEALGQRKGFKLNVAKSPFNPGFKCPEGYAPSKAGGQ